MLNLFFAAQCAHVAVPEASAEAMRYYSSGNILWIVQNAWSLIVPLLFLFTGFSGELASFSKKRSKMWYFTIVIYLILFILLYQLIDFPLDYYSEFVRPHAYGLSTQTFGHWLSDSGKSILVLITLCSAFVWIFYWLLKKSPRKWWFYSSFVAIGLSFLMMIVQPLWIDPLFHHYSPMKNKEL